MKIIVLLGKSGVGKDTILNKISETIEFKPIVSYTTRPKRKNETNLKDYFFISKNEFLQKIDNNEFIEYRTYNTLLNGTKDVWYYGITKGTVRGDSIVILDIAGLEGFLKYFNQDDVDIKSIYIDVPDDIRKKRAQKRASFDNTEWDRRVKDDEIVFEDIKNKVDFVVQNIDFNKCLEEIKDFLR